MGTRRTLIIIIAVVFAAVAAFANYAYLNSVQDRAYDNAERVEVFVVRDAIPRGTAGEDALSTEKVRSGEIPKEFVPTTALKDIQSIRGKVAITDLAAGQVVVDGMFVDPTVAQVTSAQRIPPGQATATVSLDRVAGVGGLLRPGDKVNLLVPGPNGLTVLYQNVNILFVGTQAAPQPGETQVAADPNSGLITFAVPPEAVSRIVAASRIQPFGIYLSLVPPDNRPVAIPPINEGQLFNVPLTPYG